MPCFGLMPMGSVRPAWASGVRWLALLILLVAAARCWLLPGRSSTALPQISSNLVNLSPRSCSLSNLRGGGGREEEEEFRGPWSSLALSRSRSSIPVALLVELRRPLFGGRWSVFAKQLDLLIERRSLRATVLLRLIVFLPADVPTGGSLASRERPLHHPARPCLATVARWRQLHRTKWFVPGFGAVNLPRKCIGTGSRFLCLSRGPAYSLPGLGCNFHVMFVPVVSCTGDYHHNIM